MGKNAENEKKNRNYPKILGKSGLAFSGNFKL